MIKDSYQRTNAANLKPDNVDIHRHPIHVGYVLIFEYQLFNQKKKIISNQIQIL